MRWIPCPYLGRPVELTAEREAHIRTSHAELLPGHLVEVEATLVDPDFVGEKDSRAEIAFVRYWPDLLGGRSVVVVVVPDRDRSGDTLRYWVVTAYVARQTSTWRPVWERS